MNRVLFRTAMVLAVVFGFSTNLLAAPPSKPPPVPAPVINAVATDVPGQLEIVGSALSINAITPIVKATFVDSNNVLQTYQLVVLASSTSAVAVALPTNPIPRPGNYLVSVQTSGGTSNGYEFSIIGPDQPAPLPAVTVPARQPQNVFLDASEESTFTASCDSGSVAVGGGYDENGGGAITIVQSMPHYDATSQSYNGWDVKVKALSPVTVSIRPWVICAVASEPKY